MSEGKLKRPWRRDDADWHTGGAVRGGVVFYIGGGRWFATAHHHRQAIEFKHDYRGNPGAAMRAVERLLARPKARR